MRRIKDVLADRADAGFVGRQAELDLLLGMLEEGAPPVWFLHGVPGVGKSRLLQVFAREVRQRGVAVVALDCRAVEPTPVAFLRELGAATAAETPTPEAAGDALARLGNRVVLALDAYDAFRLLDAWLRQEFLPALPLDVRVVVAGRHPPAAGWATSPGWSTLVRAVRLDPLPAAEAEEFLQRAGLTVAAARRLNRVARGLPLALQLAAAEGDRPAVALAGEVPSRMVAELTRLYLTDVADPSTRRAVEAAAVVRRATRPLLAAMLTDADGAVAFDRLRALPFVEEERDGLAVHEAVQSAIASSLRATEPDRYRAFRRAAWRRLRADGGEAGATDLWRSTADLLFLLEAPHVREAFFPTGAHRVAIEPARPADWPAILEISRRHDGPEATQALERWWARAPETFSIARDPGDPVAGFSCAFPADAVPADVMRDDPILRVWLAHLRRDPVVGRQRVIFGPRWLARDGGEGPSPVQAAFWLATKRLYLELRPLVRRVYIAQRDFAASAPALDHLGFRPLPTDVVLDGASYQAMLLDFGPASVDGWLAGLVAAELGIQDESILDLKAREIVLDGRRVGLTRLEFELFHYLSRRQGEAVSRADLLADVWGHDYDSGSNVVDAVVRSLRKKLAHRAALLETVRGTGYRLRPS